MIFLGAVGMGGYAQLITVLLVFVAVLGITAATTRWIANYQKQQGAGGNIQSLCWERCRRNSCIWILRVEIPALRSFLTRRSESVPAPQRKVGNMMNNKLKHKRIITIICLLVTVGILCIQNSMPVFATELQTGDTEDSTFEDAPGTAQTQEDLEDPNINNMFTVTVEGDNGNLNGALRILLTLTLLAILPILLIMMTSFTRVIIVLHFTRAALNTQTAPPNQILIGLALILTFFIMQPTLERVNAEAIQPFEAGEIDQEEAFERGIQPLREFMYPQTQTKDVQLFMDIADREWSGENDDIPLSVLLPSFMVSELRIAFWIGFMIYIPFIVIDMVVASTLMSMGMMMLPPTTISMPFKILLFVLADGWALVIGNLVQTFY